ncbi:hypothetical protein PROFUN_10405 [Planoprotostelium fungivorum]|uniref:Telomeric single stranded DNA binding POT1/Cdc13 domain-containing protein n=1 Tax=Planoprotostelium fungivorum TaxID=1890364 RepID=A0A2P6NE12_9EUKA|nr:hypothetical protein PROFUN_10405 [Planoprotostelium fungivorum]
MSDPPQPAKRHLGDVAQDNEHVKKQRSEYHAPIQLARESSDYQYTALRDLQIGTSAHVYGVVSAIQAPKKSIRGQDYVMTLTLCDPSYPGGMLINIFEPDESKFPAITSPGDIFRAHRMVVNNYNGKLQGLCSRKFRYAALVIGRYDGIPSITSERCTFVEEDLERIQSLKLWWEGLGKKSSYLQTVKANESDTFVNRNPVERTVNQAPARLTLGEVVEPDVDCEIICQVVHISEVIGNAPTQRIKLSVWDGTGTKPTSGQLTTPIPLHYSPASPFGFLAVVILWNEALFPVFLDGSVTAGRWVHLKGVQTKMYLGCLELKMSSQSELLPLEPTDERVEKLIDEYKTRCEILLEEAEPAEPVQSAKSPQSTKSVQPPQPAQIVEPEEVFVTTTTHDDMPITSIREILSHQRVGKYRCKAKVLSYLPRDLKKFTKPFCTKCQKSSGQLFTEEGDVNCEHCGDIISEAVWVFQLKLRDETGDMMVIGYKHNATSLFHGLPPSNLRKSNVTLDLLKKKMDQLMRENVLVDCCISSYLTEKYLKWRYQIFDTTIL